MWRWRSKRKELSCRDVVALVTDYLDGALAPAVQRRFESHLADCLSCPEYVEQIRAIAVAASRPGPTPVAPTPTEAELVELFRALKGEP